MAHIEPCGVCAGKVHIIADNGRTVCVGSTYAALGVLREGFQLGIINQADYSALQKQVNSRLDLQINELGGIRSSKCDLPHTFVSGIFDVLAVMCGTYNPHPDDVH